MAKFKDDSSTARRLYDFLGALVRSARVVEGETSRSATEYQQAKSKVALDMIDEAAHGDVARIVASKLVTGNYGTVEKTFNPATERFEFKGKVVVVPLEAIEEGLKFIKSLEGKDLSR